MSRGSRDPARKPARSPGRPGERQACTRKTRMTKIEAKLAVARWGGHYYKCGFCPGWHHAARNA